MKLLIYGTGGRAKRYIEFRYTLFFEEHEVLAFIDSNPDKKGGWFGGRPIIMPGDIDSYEYDYILIASSYEQDITNNLIKKYNVKKEKIKGEIDVKYLEEKLVGKYRKIFQNKKIVALYYDDFENLKNYKEKVSTVVGVSEFYYYKDTRQILESGFDYIVLLDPKRARNFDWRTDKYILENKIIDELEKRGFDKERIHRSSLVYSFGCSPKPVSYGCENEDITFLVIQGISNPGLVAIVSQVVKGIRYAYENDYIPVVDFQTYKCQYHESGEEGKVNAWEKFFEQPTKYTMVDVMKSKNVLLFYEIESASPLTAKDINRYIITKPAIVAKINKYCEVNNIGMLNEKVLGVLYRGSDYSNVKPYNHTIQPTLEQLISKVKDIYYGGNYEKIYICTEVQDAILRFEEEFPEQIIYYHQRRCEDSFSEYLSEFVTDSAYSWGEDYWIAINVLSRCDALVGGICGGTLYAKALNDNRYDEVYLFDLGRYKC